MVGYSGHTVHIISIKCSLSEQGSVSLYPDCNFCVAACFVWQTLMSVESRAPAVSKIAPTTPEVMNATAQQDTGSTQTDVAVMVCFALSQK